MSTKLTKKEKGFSDDILEHGNGTKAILDNYDVGKYHTAGAMATENLKKPKIVQYLEDNASDAMSRIVELSVEAKNEAVKLNANRDIVDRAGYKAVDRSVSLNATINVKENEEASKLAEEYEDKLNPKLLE